MYGSGTSSDPVHSDEAHGVLGESSQVTSAHETVGKYLTSEREPRAECTNPHAGRDLGSSPNNIATAPGKSVPARDTFIEGKGVVSPTDSNRPVTTSSGSVETSSGLGRDPTVSKGLPISKPYPSTEKGSSMPGSFDNDASSTTAIRGGVPGDSHIASDVPGTKVNEDVLPKPIDIVGPHLGPGVVPRGGVPAASEGNQYNDTRRISDNNNSTERYPLGGGNVLSDNSRSHANSSSEYNHTTDLPSEVYPNNANPKSQTGGARALNTEGDAKEDVKKDTEMVSYGPESWQHDHNKHGHQFVPVAQHETLMGALLDPHASSGSNNSLTESQSCLGRDSGMSGTAVAGAGAAWDRSRGEPASSTAAASSMSSAKDVDQGRPHEQKPASAIAAKFVMTEDSRAYARGYGNYEKSSAPATMALDSGRDDLSGPVHKSTLLNKLDPRVKEVSSTSADTKGLGQSQTTDTFSNSPTHNSAKHDPRVNAESRNDTTPIRHAAASDAAGAGAPGGAALLSAGYEAKRQHQKPDRGQEPTFKFQDRGFMGVGDTGFDHDRAELDPQRTSFAPPSAVTQALHQTPHQGLSVPNESDGIRQSPANQRIESYSKNELSRAPAHQDSRDPDVTEIGISDAISSSSHHNQVQPTPAAQVIDDSYRKDPRQESQHHYDRDAAILDTGAAAAEGLGHHDDREQTMPATQTTDSLAKDAYQDRYSRRDTASVGTGAADIQGNNEREGKHQAEFSKKEAEHMKALEKEHEKNEKVMEKEHKQKEKAVAKEYKKEEKAIAQREKEQGKHDKVIAKEQKQHNEHGEGIATNVATTETGKEEHDKHSTKEEKRHEKMHAALEKAQTREEKQFARAQKDHGKESNEEQGEKKHKGILGLFHRDKKSGGEVEKEELESRGHSDNGLTGAKNVEAGVVSPTAYDTTEHEKQQHEKHERNRLHKASSLIPSV